MASVADIEAWAQVGVAVRLRLTSGEEITASVFAYDPATTMLLLREAGMHNGVANLRFLRASAISAVLEVTKPQGPVDLKLPPVDPERCKKREQKAMQQAERDAARVGVGVTKESQAIFEALAKTLPCRWKDKTIVVLDEVFITDPYTPDMCSTDASHQDTLQRVKLVLKAERTRLGMSAD